MDRQTVGPDGAWFIGVARAIVGYMWFQQTLWKLPPDWGGPGGLRLWMEKAGTYSAPWYRTFVNDIVLPHFDLFAPQVWAGETLIAITLVFGLCGRLGGILGGIMGINLYFANSRTPGEWYWSYLFIALFGFLFFFTRAGRYLGVDGYLVPRVERLAEKHPRLAQAILWLM